MNWHKIGYGITGLLLVIVTPLAFSKDAPDPASTSSCFVILDSPPVLLHQKQVSGGASIRSAQFKAMKSEAQNYERVLVAQQNSLEREIYEIDNTAKVHHRFNQVVNALMVEIDSAKWDALRSLPGVAYVAPNRKVKPLLTNSDDLMNLPEAFEQFNGGEDAGAGIFIAIIDTGIDVTHPALRSDGYSYPDGFPKGETDFTTPKVIAARVFPPSSGDQGDTSMYDHYGHGTNVATCAAANFNVDSPLGVLSGVAPKAYLGNYKVFTSDSSDNSQIIEAIESAVSDGADVINLSLGSDIFGDLQYDLQVMAVKNAIDLGVVVVIAAGNSGKTALTIGNPAQVEEAISVGSITNSHYSNSDPSQYEVRFSAYADGEAIVDEVEGIIAIYSGPFTDPIIGTFPLQDIDSLDGGGYGTLSDGLACETLDLTEPLSGWVLCTRGTCTFASKMNTLQNLGAQGVIFMDNKTTTPLDQPTARDTTIPGIMIDQSSGMAIKDAIQSGSQVTIKIEGKTISDSKLTANQLSDFSSYGVTMNYALKPDVVAVGDGSFAGAQNDDTNDDSFNVSGFKWFAGTSFSSPRVAGMAAVLLQEHPDWPPSWIKSALMLSANPAVTLSGKTLTSFEIGGGFVDAAAAVQVDTIVVPAKLNFGVHMVPSDTSHSQWITVVNPSEKSCTYHLEMESDSNSLGITFSESQFDLDAGQKKNIAVTIPSLSGISDGDKQGTLICTNQTSDLSYRIPYWIRIDSMQTPSGDVLLLDDDSGSSYEDYYMERLDEIGTTYTLWSVKTQGYPTLDYITLFKTVVWFWGDNTLHGVSQVLPDGSTNSEYRNMFNSLLLFETELMKYLVNGGTLFLSGQDFSDDQDTSAFSQEILTVSMSDQRDGASTVQGVSGNPVSDGLGPFTMTYPQNFEKWPDYLTSLDTARVSQAFIADGVRSETIGVTIETCAYRAVYLAFPLETLDATAGTSILRKGLEWLGENANSDMAEVLSVTPNTLDITKSSSPYTITIHGNGLVFKNGYQAYLDTLTLSDLTWVDCNTLTGDVPADVVAGTYDLVLRIGNGQDLRLNNAFTVLGNSGTDIMEWSLY